MYVVTLMMLSHELSRWPISATRLCHVCPDKNMGWGFKTNIEGLICNVTKTMCLCISDSLFFPKKTCINASLYQLVLSLNESIMLCILTDEDSLLALDVPSLIGLGPSDFVFLHCMTSRYQSAAINNIPPFFFQSPLSYIYYIYQAYKSSFMFFFHSSISLHLRSFHFYSLDCLNTWMPSLLIHSQCSHDH